MELPLLREMGVPIMVAGMETNQMMALKTDRHGLD